MARAIGDIEKSRGRPRTNATPVMVRLAPEQLAALDAWIAQLGKPVSRPEAIRAILAAGLSVMNGDADEA